MRSPYPAPQTASTSALMITFTISFDAIEREFKGPFTASRTADQLSALVDKLQGDGISRASRAPFYAADRHPM